MSNEVTYTFDGGYVVYPDGTRLRAISGGGTSDTKQTQTQTTVKNVAPPTPEEAAAQAMASAQLKTYESLLESFQKSPQYTLSQDISQRAQQNLLDRLNGTSPLLLPQEEAYLNQAFAAPTQQALDSLRAQAIADAQRRGMTLTDSPTGNEYLRQFAAIQADAASKRAQAGLNLSQQNQGNWQNAAQFGQSIQQQALQNRLGLQNQAMQFGNALAQNRIAMAPTTTTGTVRGSTSQPLSQTFAQVGQGLGGLFGSRDVSAVGGMLNIGSGLVDPQGFIRQSIVPAVKNVVYSANDYLKGTPGANTVPLYGNVGNVPPLGYNTSFDGSRWD